MIGITIYYLVGGLEHLDYDFPQIGKMSASQVTNSIIFQRGRLKPPSSYYWLAHIRVKKPKEGSSAAKIRISWSKIEAYTYKHEILWKFDSDIAISKWDKMEMFSQKLGFDW